MRAIEAGAALLQFLFEPVGVVEQAPQRIFAATGAAAAQHRDRREQRGDHGQPQAGQGDIELHVAGFPCIGDSLPERTARVNPRRG
uniref:Uncharacterized protein n=1 Tax=Mizugakiibacter sediminis TaxID=1475481 RepID=A0A0S6YZI9_9GAMM